LDLLELHHNSEDFSALQGEQKGVSITGEKALLRFWSWDSNPSAALRHLPQRGRKYTGIYLNYTIFAVLFEKK
jgi:hypothetical protein